MATIVSPNQIVHLVPAAEDGYDKAILFGMPKRPSLIKLISRTESHIFSRVKGGQYRLREDLKDTDVVGD